MNLAARRLIIPFIFAYYLEKCVYYHILFLDMPEYGISTNTNHPSMKELQGLIKLLVFTNKLSF